MHLLLIHQAFISPNDAGGTRHFEFARYLQSRGHTMTIVASDLNYLSGKRVAKSGGLVSAETVEGISVLRARTLAVLHKSFVWRVISFFSFMASSIIAATRAKDVDVVMGTTPPIFQAASAWAVAAMRRKPFLLEVRDLWPDFAIDMGVLKNPLLIKMSRWLEGFLYRRARHIIVNSPAYRDYLMRKGIPESKISLVPNGVDPAMFMPEAKGREVREKFGLGDQFVASYAGAMGVANDLDTLLRAAERLKDHEDITILLVGDGKERPQLEQQVAERSLTNVAIIGPQPKNQMAQFLAASDACVAILKNIPMFATTYPNKVFDYMAAGRPTVLAIDGVIRDVMEEADGGIFVPPGNDAELAAAILRLHDARAEATRMGQRARKYVTEHLDRRTQAEKFLEVTTELCGKL